MFKKFLELQHNEETSRVGNKWLSEEDYKLLKEITDKKSFEDIALEHKRTIVGIKARVISHILYAQYKDGIKTIDELSYEYNIEKNLVEKYIRTINNNNAIKKSIEQFKYDNVDKIYGVNTNNDVLFEKIISLETKMRDIEQKIALIITLITK